MGTLSVLFTTQILLQFYSNSKGASRAFAFGPGEVALTDEGWVQTTSPFFPNQDQ